MLVLAFHADDAGFADALRPLAGKQRHDAATELLA